VKEKTGLPKGTGTGKVTFRGLLQPDDPIYKEGWTVTLPQSGKRSSTPSNSTPDTADAEVTESEYLRRDEDNGEEADPSNSGTVIDPEDGLFQAMAELEKKLGPKEFLKRLLKYDNSPKQD
jgi:hypothetical protein